MGRHHLRPRAERDAGWHGPASITIPEDDARGAHRVVNQLLSTRKIVRTAPPERLRCAEQIERITAEAGLPERGAHQVSDPRAET